MITAQLACWGLQGWHLASLGSEQLAAAPTSPATHQLSESASGDVQAGGEGKPGAGHVAQVDVGLSLEELGQVDGAAGMQAKGVRSREVRSRGEGAGGRTYHTGRRQPLACVYI